MVIVSPFFTVILVGSNAYTSFPSAPLLSFTVTVMADGFPLSASVVADGLVVSLPQAASSNSKTSRHSSAITEIERRNDWLIEKSPYVFYLVQKVYAPMLGSGQNHPSLKLSCIFSYQSTYSFS